MTCIVAVQQDDRVYLGTDSWVGDEAGQNTLAHPKWVVKGPRFVIGYAGSVRAANILNYHVKFRKRKKNESIEQYLVTEVADKLRKAFYVEGTNVQSATTGDRVDSEFLIAIEGELYSIYCDYSVVKYSTPYAAVGAGMGYAMGALGALDISEYVLPREKLRIALEMSAKFCPAVSKPFHIIEV